MVAFQGELGAFSHSAALKLLGERINLHPLPTFKEVFDALGDGRVEYAVIPIENTLHGSVHENYDHLLNYNFAITGETSIRISHQLIALPGVSLSQIRRALSHPVALNQCKRFFEENTSIQPAPYYDTAGSVKALVEGDLKDTAAIASRIAAETYGGIILMENIEDSSENFTRFFLLTKQSSPLAAQGQPKTSIVFSTANRSGALFRAIACFALRDLNLTKIESRPLRDKPWEYFFYVDFLGSVEDETVMNALANLRECTQFLKLLGSYCPTP
jgi:prephenate dehydratase